MRAYEIMEEFFDAFKLPDRDIEIFKNPTKNELNEINQADFIRGFLTENSLLVWNAFDSVHLEIAQYLNLNSDEAVAIYLFYSPHQSDIEVTVTDYNRRGKWYHNSELKDWILNHPAWWVPPFKIQVSYYDEDIVGKWEDL